MLTIENLKEYGADVADGLARCMNNESFYLRMVGLGIADGAFEKLDKALAAHDLDGAFEAAHALKGILGNLSLTPMLKVVSEMTEYLRAREDRDYSEMLAKVHAERAKLQALL